MVRKAWRTASKTCGRARDRLEPSMAGRIWYATIGQVRSHGAVMALVPAEIGATA